MADDAIWALEESLWTGDAQRYHDLVADACVMVVPAAPFILSGAEAIETVAATPRWSRVEFSQQRSAQPHEGLVAIAYNAVARRDGADDYEAYCTTTWHRDGEGEWRVVQHQQLPPITAGAG